MDDKNYILFEEYCSELLSVEERESFEARLRQDNVFSESFIVYKELTGFLESKFENEKATIDFKDNLRAISDTHFEKKEETKVIRFRPWQYATAASVLLLVGVFIFNRDINPKYSNFAVHDTISLAVRGSQDQLYSNAEKAFNNGAYEKALSYFEALKETNEENSELALYTAISQLEVGFYKKAEQTFIVIAEGNSVYRNTALWYMALSKLKQKEYKASREFLEKIPHEYEKYEKVNELLSELD